MSIRRYFFLLVLALMASMQTLSAQTFTDPVAYNDRIVEYQTAINEKIIDFNNAVGNPENGKDAVMVYHEALLQRAKKSAELVKQLPAYKGNVSLRNSASDLFDFYVRIIEAEYKSLIDIVYLENPTEEDYAKLEAIMAKVTEEERGYDSKFQAEQEAFAKTHNFQLQSSEVEEETGE